MVRWKAHSQGYTAALAWQSHTRDAAEKSWPEVRLFDAPLAGRARLPAKSFRLAEAAREGAEASGTRRGSYLHQFCR